MLNQDEERVTDSVQTLIGRCNKMFEDAKEYDLIQLNSCISDVQVAIDSLQEEFNKDSYDEWKVYLLKQAVEREAIILEYYLQTVCSKYRETYLLRVFVENACQDVIGYSKLVTLNGNKEETIRWADYARFVLKLKKRSLHLNFEVSKDEMKHLDNIIREMGDVKHE